MAASVFSRRLANVEHRVREAQAVNWAELLSFATEDELATLEAIVVKFEGQPVEELPPAANETCVKILSEMQRRAHEARLRSFMFPRTVSIL